MRAGGITRLDPPAAQESIPGLQCLLSPAVWDSGSKIWPHFMSAPQTDQSTGTKRRF